MKTDIENIIKKNRAQLDIENPPSDSWDEVRKSLSPDKAKAKSHSIQWWKAAAVLFLATSVSLLIYNMSLKEQVDELASLGDISNEYKNVEQSYQHEIGQLTSKLSVNEILKAEDLAWMADELKALEEVNNQYRQDIGKAGDQELLVEALIDYYEKKIRLLKKLELEINRQKNEERTTTDLSAI